MGAVVGAWAGASGPFIGVGAADGVWVEEQGGDVDPHEGEPEEARDHEHYFCAGFELLEVHLRSAFIERSWARGQSLQRSPRTGLMWCRFMSRLNAGREIPPRKFAASLSPLK